ncbi:hypothetical protein MMPV_007121 [Pyropia vietnamensis]
MDTTDHDGREPPPPPQWWRLPRRARLSTTPRWPPPGKAAAAAAAAGDAAAVTVSGGAAAPAAAVAATPAATSGAAAASAAPTPGQAESLLPSWTFRQGTGSSGCGVLGMASGYGDNGTSMAETAARPKEPQGRQQEVGSRFGGSSGGDGSGDSGRSSGSSDSGGARDCSRAKYRRRSSSRGPSSRRCKASAPLLVVAVITAAALGVLGLVPLSTRQNVLGRARRQFDTALFAGGGGLDGEEDGGRGQSRGHPTEGSEARWVGAPSPRPQFRARLTVGAWKVDTPAAAVAPPPPLPPPAAASATPTGVTIWAPDRSACAGSFVWGDGAAVRLREVVPDRRASSAAEAAAGRPDVAASVRYMLLFTTVMPVVLAPSSRVGHGRAPRGSRVGGVWSPPGWEAGGNGDDRRGSSVSSAEAWGFGGHERGDDGSGGGRSGDGGDGGDVGAAWSGNATLSTPIPGVGMALDHLAHTAGERRHGRDEWVGILTFYTLPGGPLTSADDLAAALAASSARGGGGDSGVGGPTLTLSLPVAKEATTVATAPTDAPPATTGMATLAFSLACVTGWDASAPVAATPRVCPKDPLAVPGGRSVLLCSNALYGRLSGLEGIPAVAEWAARALRGPAAFTTVGLLAAMPVGLSTATASCGRAAERSGSAAAVTRKEGLAAKTASASGVVPSPSPSVGDCVAASMTAAAAAMAKYATAVGAALTAARVPAADHHRLVLMPWCGLGSGPDEAPTDEGGGGPCSTSYMVAQFGAQYAAYGLLGGGHTWAASLDLDEFLGGGLGDNATPLSPGTAGTLFATTLGGLPGVNPPSSTTNITADAAAAAAAVAAAAGPSAGTPVDGAVLARWVDFQVPDAVAAAALTRQVTSPGAPALSAAVEGNVSACVGKQGKSAMHCSRGVGFLIHDVAVLRAGAGASAGLGAPVRLRPPVGEGVWTMHGRYRPRTGDCMYVGDSTKTGRDNGEGRRG